MTRQEALTVKHGQTLYHRRLRNADGTASRCRVNGQTKTWKTRPQDFQLPVKAGLRQYFYITQRNQDEWALAL